MSFKKTRIKNIYEDTESGIYYVRIRRKGKKPFNKSLDTKNFKTASQVGDDLVREYLGHAPKRQQHRLFKDETKVFLTSYETKVKKPTYVRMEHVLRLHILPYWGNTILTDITAGAWDLYIKTEKAKGGRNLSNDKKAMGNVLTFAMGEGRLSGVPKLQNPNPQSDVGREYSDDELSALASTAAELGTEAYYAIQIGAQAGCRMGEIVSIPWASVNFKERFFEVRGKTGKRKCAMGSSLTEVLEEHHKMRFSQWLFPMKTKSSKHMSTNLMDKEWQAVKGAAKVYGRFHDLRHTYITRALRAGHSILKVSKQVGSSVQTITKVYEHLNVSDLAALGDVVNVTEKRENIGVGLVQGD